MDPIRISVVVPSHDRATALRRCLEALADVDYPRSLFEVIVVDDGSDPPVEDVVAAYHDRIDITCLKQARRGPAAARNAGAARATGFFLAFLDDDCLAGRDWLSALRAQIAVTPEHLIGGRTLNALPDRLFSSASQLLIDYLYDYYNVKSPRASFFASNNMAIPREQFLAIGGFDEGFPQAGGEDRDLSERWLRHGFRMTYAPNALVSHAHPLTLTTFWRQNFRYGRAAFTFRQSNSQRQGGPLAFEPLRFYRELLLYPFARARGAEARRLAFAFGLSQAANTMGFLSGALRARFRRSA